MKPQKDHSCPVRAEIEEHIPHLRRYARSLAHNPVAADDLLQDCLTRALVKAHLFQKGTNLRAWLFTILHNLHVSERRRAVQEGFPVDPDLAGSALAVAPDQDKRMVMRALGKAMAVLPKEQRTAIRMVAIDGMAYEDVANALDLPVGTVKSRISRGRVALRQTMDGGDLRARQASDAPAGGPERIRPLPHGPHVARTQFTLDKAAAA